MTDELNALKLKLDTLSHDALKQAERDALHKVGDLILGAIVTNAPERTEYDGGDLQPGDLKAGFRVSVHIATDQGVVRSDDHSRAIIKPTSKVAHVARLVEDGHANRPGSKTPNTPAHPYVRPALDEKRDEAIALYTETMTEAIKKAINE